MNLETLYSQPQLAQRLTLRQRPSRPAVMYQHWRELLFLHWTYDPAQIQRTLPSGLYVDTFEGQAYLGIVPFFMRHVRPRFAPSVPGISNFLELNVRTYVHDGHGTAGVWFYSLDASQWLAVQVARLFFRLPYFYAAMQAERNGTEDAITYTSRRRGVDPALPSRFRYGGRGPLRQAQSGSLEFFLVERYVLFAYGDGQLYTGRVHHLPYPLQDQNLVEWDSNLLVLDGFQPPGRPPDHVIGSPGVEVDIFALQKTGNL
jgi:uncharacterized protein YqjF (DUF2071 family)